MRQSGVYNLQVINLQTILLALDFFLFFSIGGNDYNCNKHLSSKDESKSYV